MDAETRQKIELLAACTFLPASYNKRFAHGLLDMAHQDPPKELTPKQAANLDRLFHMYRRQIKDHWRLCPKCRPTMTVHVSKNVRPETLQALAEAGRIILENYNKGEPNGKQETSAP